MAELDVAIADEAVPTRQAGYLNEERYDVARAVAIAR